MLFFEKVLFPIVFITFTTINSNNAASGDSKQEAKCLLPMEPGPCRMNLERFYYNVQTDTCEKFKFGGCMGNDNKFGFKQTCEAACKKSTDSKVAAAKTEKSQIKSEGTILSVTTAKPALLRTTVKMSIATPTKSVTTTTQKSQIKSADTTLSVTTAKPALLRTTVKTSIAMPTKSVTTTTQKPKPISNIK